MKTLIKKSTGEFYVIGFDEFFTSDIPKLYPDTCDLKTLSAYNPMMDFSDCDLIDAEVTVKIPSTFMPGGRCVNGCTYSKSMNQIFPRKCIHCNKEEIAVKQILVEPKSETVTPVSEKSEALEKLLSEIQYIHDCAVAKKNHNIHRPLSEDMIEATTCIEVTEHLLQTVKIYL